MPATHSIRDLKLYPSSKTSAEWSQVDAAVRNNSFFSACVEDERILGALQKLVAQATEEGWSVSSFIDKAFSMLDEIKLSIAGKATEAQINSLKTLYDSNRLRLIYTTQKALAAGYRQVMTDFEDFHLQMRPAWKFHRQPGAIEDYKRPDHVRNQDVIRLKTDIKYWLRRNRAEIGGFGNPFAPWGFNSFMRSVPVKREEVEKLGLIKPGQRLVIPAEYAKWGIVNTLKNIGTAGVSDLSAEQQNRVIDRCAEEGINVEKDETENKLKVEPKKEESKQDAQKKESSDPLTALENDTMEDWFEQEMKRMESLSEEEILNELLSGN